MALLLHAEKNKIKQSASKVLFAIIRSWVERKRTAELCCVAVEVGRRRQLVGNVIKTRLLYWNTTPQRKKE